MKEILSTAFLSVLAVTGLLLSDVSAFQVNTTNSGQPIKWPTPSAGYLINVTGGPAGSTDAVSGGMQVWSSVPGSAFRFNVTSSTAMVCDGNSTGNGICFGPVNQQGVIAQNEFWYNPTTGAMIKSAITFNTIYRFSIGGSTSSFDVQDIITHELGHTLSLKDLYSASDSNKTMYGYSSYGETYKRVLSDDDKAGIVFLYPISNTPAACTYSLSPTSVSAGSGGGKTAIAITTQTGCAWTASSSLSWVTLDMQNGKGSGTVNLTVASNTTTSTRVGNITVAGKTIGVTQEAATVCTYTVSPPTVSAGASGGKAAITITTQTGCAWTASSSLSWATLDLQSGKGSGTVSLNVTANTSTATRSGSVTVAGKTIAVSQEAKALSQGIAANPAYLAFGSVKVDSSSVKSIALTITGKVSAVAAQIAGSDPSSFGVSGTCKATSTGATCAINVTFRPLSKGSKAANMVFSVPGSSMTTTVPLSGTGI